MKKTSNRITSGTRAKRQLKLRRDTVRQLSEGQLTAAIGGGCITTTDPTVPERTGKTILTCP